MLKIAVSGAAGYVGSALVQRLRSRAHVLRVNRRRGPSISNTETIVGDLCNREVVSALIRDVDIIVHCAAYTGEGDRLRAYRDNVLATQTLCEALQPGQRLIYLSSVAVYGKKRHAKTHESAPIDVKSSVYAASKVEAERYIECHVDDAIVLRPGLVWGGSNGRLVRELCPLLRRGLVIFPGACESPLPLTHIDNLLDGIEAAIRSTERGPFNLTDDAEVTFREFCQRLAQSIGVEAPRSQVPTRLLRLSVRLLNRLPTALGQRLRPDILALLNTECTFDNTRARERLGYRPRPREHLQVPSK